MRMTPAEKFFRYIHRHCTQPQIETLYAKMKEGWKPFKVCGTTAEPKILCSMPTGVRSNIAPAHDHLRIYHDGKCVRYDPRAR